MNILEIAILCHSVNKAYCHLIGNHSQKPWPDAPEWQKQSAINGVKFHLDNPLANPIDSHDNWLKEKEADGWVFGEIKDEAAKTHPCMRPYHELSIEQRIKDQLFINTIKAVSI